jgi:outer membrane lipopolysaccharide assembly protein LptE/RlpB
MGNRKESTMKGVFSLALLLAMLSLSGCMHYAKGTGTHLAFDRIYVAPVRNDSFASQSQALLTKQVRRKLADEPNLEITATPKNAAVLEITIVKFEQTTATRDTDDTVRAKSFNVQMSVVCTLTDGATGKAYFKDCDLSDSVECHTFADYQEARHQIMPKLTEKLATRICEAVCNPW